MQYIILHSLIKIWASDLKSGLKGNMLKYDAITVVSRSIESLIDYLNEQWLSKWKEDALGRRDN